MVVVMVVMVVCCFDVVRCDEEKVEGELEETAARQPRHSNRTSVIT